MMKNTIWLKAVNIAQATPADRNRYVDLLRALSISAVVLGHWILAAPYFMDENKHMEHLLHIQPWSQWLTWVFQVMPVFFFVGGYANGVSWDGAKKKGISYVHWLESRMRRLLGPCIVLVFVWVILGFVAYFLPLSSSIIQIGSQISLVPVWFLAIYFVIVMLVPITRKAWHQFGFISVVIPIAFALLLDWVFFNSAWKSLSWLNYLFVWSAVHQIGYAWQQDRLFRSYKAFIVGALGLTVLYILTHFGPYPLSLVGVPSDTISNTTPPKLPLLALAFAQIGFLMSIETSIRKLLLNKTAWSSVVLVNGLIMPIFLWHSTVMMLLIGMVFWLFPNVLSSYPGTTEWWLQRPIWICLYSLIMCIVLPILVKSEQLVATNQQPYMTRLQLFIAAICICLGLALLANSGVVGNGAFGLNWYACLLPLLGACIALFKVKDT